MANLIAANYDLVTNQIIDNNSTLIRHAIDHLLISNRSVAFIGDSLAAGLHYTWGVAVSSPSAYPNSAGRIHFRGGDDGVTLAGTGLFVFNSLSGTMRWSAPGDSFGPETTCSLGFTKLESATANMALHLYVLAIPTADSSIAVTFSGIRTTHNTGSISGRASIANLIESEFANTLSIVRLACGGSLASDCSVLLPYFKSAAPGVGYDVIVTGTNDIANGVGSASIISSVTSLVLNRLVEGRKIVLVGIGARYQTGTTPISAGYLSSLIATNKGFADLADTYKGGVVYVDAFNMLVDPANSDGRPAANLLYDEVHWGAGAIAKIAPEVIKALKLLGAPTSPRFVADGDINWYDFNGVGWLYGSGGVVGANTTSGSGLPASTNSAATATASATVDIGTFSDHGRRLITIVYTSTGASQYARLYTSSISLGSIGLAVGDTIQFYADIEVVSCGSSDNIYAQCLLMGTSFGLELDVGNIPGRHRFTSPPVKIATGTTALQWLVYCASSSVTSGTVKVGDLLVKKVS